VIHSYPDGWMDGTVYAEPMTGAKQALEHLEADGWEVVIFSTREPSQIVEALQRWGFPAYRVTDRKEPAIVQIDDRAIRFEDWSQTLADLHRLYPLRTEA
jgi:hypothetical protein